MFWLATINPGKTRKRRSRRRRLSTWQKMVKEYGGVMAAVRASRRRRRVKVKASEKRRSMRLGRKLRSRRPRTLARRSVMARIRIRRRRLPPRGRSGRFVRGGRRRRVRRNSWFDDSRGHARAARLGWRRRRARRARRGRRVWRNPVNPWARFRIPGRVQVQWRGRRGRFQVYSRRRYRRNAVIPVSWNRRSRRGYRRNAVLPISLTNPVGALSGVVDGVLGRVQDLVDVSFWTDTALPVTAGFLGSKVVGGAVFGLVGEKLLGVKSGDKAAPFVRAGSNAIAGAALAWAAGSFLGRQYEEPIWLGTVVSVAHDLLKALLGGTEIAKAIGLEGFGEDLTKKMQEAVARRVQAELSGMGTYLTAEALQRQSALQGIGHHGEFLTENALRRQSDYAPTPGADLRDYDVARTETAL